MSDEINSRGRVLRPVAPAVVLFALLVLSLEPGRTQAKPFRLSEATVADIHDAYRSRRLTARHLVQLYLDRIAAYDKKGPSINAIITVNAKALEDADRLDATFNVSGPVGPLHGIPVILKDQIDTKGMPTTLGSILLKDYYPDKDAFVTEKLRKAGAIILAKATLGELGGGDTHGSLFGSTRNPYALERTAGGSSGGPGASIAANFAAIGVGQESYASIRRPATWNSLVGMRPTAGLVSRSGVYDGAPQLGGSLGPMTRSVEDSARLLDVLVGHDPEDPLTSLGVGHVPVSYTDFLDRNGLQGARIGILREPIGAQSEPTSEDFAKVSAVFDRAVAELRAAGASVVDPIVIPRVNELLAKRAIGPTEGDESIRRFFSRTANPPFTSRDDMLRSPDFSKLFRSAQNRLRTFSVGLSREPDATSHYQYLLARDELMMNVLEVMAENDLDAIVHKGMEHQPTFIKDGVNPPWVNTKGAPHLNTFLIFVPAIVVPAGFTTDDFPVAITFMGRPYDDGIVIKLAYGFEQATRHRRPPSTTPPLAGEP